MSVLIKGMEMPRHCKECSLLCDYDDCYFCGYQDGFLYVFGESYLVPNKRPEWCPLIEVPTPHGRLIDADELEVDTEWSDYYDGYQSYSAMQIKYAPTVIESED